MGIMRGPNLSDAHLMRRPSPVQHWHLQSEGVVPTPLSLLTPIADFRDLQAILRFFNFQGHSQNHWKLLYSRLQYIIVKNGLKSALERDARGSARRVLNVSFRLSSPHAAMDSVTFPATMRDSMHGVLPARTLIWASLSVQSFYCGVVHIDMFDWPQFQPLQRSGW